jgi:hypothetical protein
MNRKIQGSIIDSINDGGIAIYYYIAIGIFNFPGKKTRMYVFMIKKLIYIIYFCMKR